MSLKMSLRKQRNSQNSLKNKKKKIKKNKTKKEKLNSRWKQKRVKILQIGILK